jgi:hypothetical protein
MKKNTNHTAATMKSYTVKENTNRVVADDRADTLESAPWPFGENYHPTDDNTDLSDAMPSDAELNMIRLGWAGVIATEGMTEEERKNFAERNVNFLDRVRPCETSIEAFLRHCEAVRSVTVNNDHAASVVAADLRAMAFERRERAMAYFDMAEKDESLKETLFYSFIEALDGSDILLGLADILDDLNPTA